MCSVAVHDRHNDITIQRLEPPETSPGSTWRNQYSCNAGRPAQTHSLQTNKGLHRYCQCLTMSRPCRARPHSSAAPNAVGCLAQVPNSRNMHPGRCVSSARSDGALTVVCTPRSKASPTSIATCAGGTCQIAFPIARLACGACMFQCCTNPQLLLLRPSRDLKRRYI